MRHSMKGEIDMAARREAMLREGFRLFSERGIESVFMQEIADACGLSLATLYRYYKNKLSLVIAIGTRKWQDYARYAKAVVEANVTDDMTAAEQLAFHFDLYIDLYRNHKELLRFNQNFNNYIRYEGAGGEQLREYIESISALGGFFNRIYEKGRADGTIRTDMPEDKMFASTSHIMLAVAVRYAQGLLFNSEHEDDRTEEFELLKRALLHEFVTD